MCFCVCCVFTESPRISHHKSQGESGALSVYLAGMEIAMQAFCTN